MPIKKSFTDDYIVCLEDGKKLKMLKRHLSTAYGMTPEEYRAKWGLPADYPMVAPAYALKRRQLAAQRPEGLTQGSTRAVRAGDRHHTSRTTHAGLWPDPSPLCFVRRFMCADTSLRAREWLSHTWS